MADKPSYDVERRIAAGETITNETVVLTRPITLGRGQGGFRGCLIQYQGRVGPAITITADRDTMAVLGCNLDMSALPTGLYVGDDPLQAWVAQVWRQLSNG